MFVRVIKESSDKAHYVLEIERESIVSCRRLPPAMSTSIQSTQADKAPYPAHCHYNKTFGLVATILELLVMVFILFVIYVNIVDILCV